MDLITDLLLLPHTIPLLTILGALLVSTSSFLLYVSLKNERLHIVTNAPQIKDLCNPELSSAKKTSVTLTFCKKCGGHAIKNEEGEQCLSATCRFKNK